MFAKLLKNDKKRHVDAIGVNFSILIMSGIQKSND